MLRLSSKNDQFSSELAIRMPYKRTIRFNLADALSTSPAVLITGARQSGKTTLVTDYFKNKSYHYSTFDDQDTFSAAKRDPQGFIERLPKPSIIDEVQRVPDILLPIKRDIDLNRLPGRYILTESTNSLFNPLIKESLAGRLETLKLYPLSQGELIEHTEDFISKAFMSDMTFRTPKDSISKEDLYKSIIKGGYPAVESFSANQRNAWFKYHIDSILQKDIRDLPRIRAIKQLPNLLGLLATRAARILDGTELSPLNNVSQPTLRHHIRLLIALNFIGYSQPLNPRLGHPLKSSKLYFVDTGILSFLQGITVERMLKEPQCTENLLENFVWSELTKQTSWSDIPVKIYHFRPAGDIEVDLLLEDQMGRIVGIAVKNSETVQSHDFKGLDYLSNVLGPEFVRGIVMYTGKTAVPFGKNLFALPISSLWAA